MAEEIINRVSSSSLISIDLEDYYHPSERVLWDLKPLLFQGMILRETDLREYVKNHDWSSYTNKSVAIICSEDAIIPTWAYMLIASKLRPFTHKTIFGTLEDLNEKLFEDALKEINIDQYKDAKVVIKGCSKREVPVSIYVKLTDLLTPIVNSLMYGEPCSTVPIFKKPK